MDEHSQKVMELRRDGWGAYQISYSLNLPADYCREVFRLNGLGIKDEDFEDFVIELRRRGWGARFIAFETGDKFRVNKILHQNALGSKDANWRRILSEKGFVSYLSRPLYKPLEMM